MLLPRCNPRNIARAVSSELMMGEMESENGWCSVSACILPEHVRACDDKDDDVVVNETGVKEKSSCSDDVDKMCCGARVVSNGDKAQCACVENDVHAQNERTVTLMKIAMYNTKVNLFHF